MDMADEATQAPADAQGQQDAGNGNGSNALSDGAGKARLFTQDEMNAAIEQRLSRTKAQFKDYDELKQAASRLAELESQNQTEFEKLRTAADKHRTAAEEAAQREQQALERANNVLLRAAVIAEASRQRAVDPDAVVALLDKSKLTIGDDDQVDGVSDAVSALLEERPYLVGHRPNGGFDGGARGGATPAQSTNADLNAQIRRAAGFA